jgi:hypothetical protein
VYPSASLCVKVDSVKIYLRPGVINIVILLLQPVVPQAEVSFFENSNTVVKGSKSTQGSNGSHIRQSWARHNNHVWSLQTRATAMKPRHFGFLTVDWFE